MIQFSDSDNILRSEQCENTTSLSYVLDHDMLHVKTMHEVLTSVTMEREGQENENDKGNEKGKG